ncbi:mCG147798 [Mus musculus]|nr:mCG147798 [Mus musculus]
MCKEVRNPNAFRGLPLLHWLLLLANRRHLLFKAKLPTAGQSAEPLYKTYKFGIFSMMSCLKMISWAKERNCILQRTCAHSHVYATLR